MRCLIFLCLFIRHKQPLIFRKFILAIIFVFLSISSFAHPHDSLENQSPVRKGRWIAIIGGVINSGTVVKPDSSISNKKFSNNYAFNISGYKFIKNRLGIGVVFDIARSSNEELFLNESEVFNLGPSVRYYLANLDQGGAFVQSAVIYSRFYDRIALLDISNPVDKVLKGRGPGIAFGLGYSYVFKDIVSLEIGFRLTYSWLTGETVDQIANTNVDTDFRRFSFSFSFGLGILIGK